MREKWEWYPFPFCKFGRGKWEHSHFPVKGVISNLFSLGTNEHVEQPDIAMQNALSYEKKV